MRNVLAALAALTWMWMGAGALAQTEAPFKPEVGQAGKDVIWVPTPDGLVSAMLNRAAVRPDDLVYDLGSGDGKIAIAAARDFGARAIGLEYNPDMVALARREAEKAGVSAKVEFRQADIFASDFSEADVVTLYLLPSLNLRLRPTLLAMRPGTRIVSNSFDMGDWTPDDTVSVPDGVALYWVVPAQAGGRWRLDGQGGPVMLDLTQTFQKLEGSGTAAGRPVRVTGSMAGAAMTVTLRAENGATWRLRGQVAGAGFSGSLAAGTGAARPLQGDRIP